jgi:uncharacterized protein (DUF1810 family)
VGEPDPFDLERFVGAQARVFDGVLAELRSGRKTSHWMWYVFPQLRGLGFSRMADIYGISALAEAVAYAAHPLLGPRLRQCTQLVNEVEGRSALQIFGSPDDLKFHSSMTLFHRASPESGVFEEALRKYFAGAEDRRSLELLAERG